MGFLIVTTALRFRMRERHQRPKLSDPAHEGTRLQPGRDGRVRSAWLGRSRTLQDLLLGALIFLLADKFVVAQLLEATKPLIKW